METGFFFFLLLVCGVIAFGAIAAVGRRERLKEEERQRLLR
jgi:hypothetical protein